MTRWAIGGTMLLAGLAAVASVGLTRRGPEIVVNAEVTPEPATPVPSPPAEPQLARVFDVTDIDPLLDPPQAPTTVGPAPVLTAVGYEEPTAPAPPVGDVPPIPPAANDDEPAAAESPLARLSLRPPLVDVVGDLFKVPVPAGLGELPVRAVRAGWYGDELSLIEGTVADFWTEWVAYPPGHVGPRQCSPGLPGGHGIRVDVGLFF